MRLIAVMYTGVGFAIGIDTVRRVVPQLIATGKVVRPALNIQVCSILALLCTSILCQLLNKPACWLYLVCVMSGSP